VDTLQNSSNYPGNIERALQAALKTSLATKSKTARALEAGTNVVLKVENG
jgi:hypothetical protein|tara:strand:+ start:36 stop:185 length:150 start_codon:yes stop_codon:yes gene_type:complete